MGTRLGGGGGGMPPIKICNIITKIEASAF